jgi:hypothetical protein
VDRLRRFVPRQVLRGEFDEQLVVVQRAAQCRITFELRGAVYGVRLQ